ncbi:porin family protein [bacterium]|nr:porin family protein [bacterium]MCI0604043.1 porin family protein [bacterium]
MNRVPILVFTLLLFLAAPPLFAQKSEITLYAGGFFGDSFIIRPAPIFEDIEAVFDDDVTVGFRYAYYFHPHLALEGGIGFTPASILASGNVSGGSDVNAIFDVDTYVLQGNILYRFTQGSVVPYVTAGIGAVHFDINTARFGFLTPSETDFALNAGGGLKFRLHEEYFFRLDGRVYWMDPEFAEEDSATFAEITGGISVLFDF